MDIVVYLLPGADNELHHLTANEGFQNLQAFKYFDARFVHKCGVALINDYRVIVGHVETANCTCVAGAVEHKHSKAVGIFHGRGYQIECVAYSHGELRGNKEDRFWSGMLCLRNLCTAPKNNIKMNIMLSNTGL